MIAIVDLGLGNIGSVANMFHKIGIETAITADPIEVATAPALVLPGVGAFDRGAAALTRTGLREVLVDRANSGVPLLGICLGMQLLARRSDEGTLPGLGLLAADVRRLRVGSDGELRVPHMGWNRVEPTRPSPLLAGEGAQRFYFVHSYAVVCDDDEDVLAWTTYGARFASAVERGSVVGTQFHPEKSHVFGMALLAAWAGAVVETRG